jgi:hypothetical protein
MVLATGRAALRGCTLAALAFSFGCATSELRQAPPPSVDVVELFRRARFKELSELDRGGSAHWVERIKTRAMSEGEDLADWSARVAYRRGDAVAARSALNALGAENRTRKIISALLDNVDASAPLRVTTRRPAGLVELPLIKEALALGLPVLDIEIQGRRFRMLWDTGASENVLSPRAVGELELVRTDVQFPVLRDVDGYVVRFAATGTPEVQIGPWSVRNVPWLVADLETVAKLLSRATAGLDGFLSPQLLIPQGCFRIDLEKQRLAIGFDPDPCDAMLKEARQRAPVFTWNGEVYASARIHQSPEVAVQLETGSPITFLRSDATRYLPSGTIKKEDKEEEIAHALDRTVAFDIAGRRRMISAIDLEPRRITDGHDDLATLGTDLLLLGRGLVVSFSSMELGLLGGEAPPAPDAAHAGGRP